MSQPRRSAARIVLTLSDQGVVSLSSFLTAALVAKATSPAEYGLFTVLLSTVLIVNGVTAALLSAPYKVLGVRASQDIGWDEYLTHLVIQLPLAMLLAAGGLAVVSTLERLDVAVAALFLAWALLLPSQDLLRTHYLVTFRYGALFTTDLTTHLVRILLLIALAAATVRGLEYALLAIVLGFAVGNAMALRGVHQASLAGVALRHIAGRNWGFGRWVLIETLLAAASVQIYVYLTAAHLSLETAGGLGAAQAVANAANVLILGVVNYAEPQVRSTLLREGVRPWARRLLSIGGVLFLVVIGLMAAVSLAGQSILSLLFGPPFSQWHFLLPPLGVAVALSSVNTMFSALFRTAEMPYVGLLARAVSAVVSAMVAVPLLARFGASGAAYGIALSQACWALTYLAYFGSRRQALIAAASAIAARGGVEQP